MSPQKKVSKGASLLSNATMTIGDEDLDINPILEAKISSKAKNMTKMPNLAIGGDSPPKYLGNQLQYK